MACCVKHLPHRHEDHRHEKMTFGPPGAKYGGVCACNSSTEDVG